MSGLKLDSQQALVIVARTLLCRLVKEHAADEWESYPEIGEDDWKQIVQHAWMLAGPEPTTQFFTAAYNVLEQRANDDTPAPTGKAAP